jgi:RHS repeat-associated protein
VPGGSQTLDYNAFDMPKRITPSAGSAVPDVELEYDAFQSRAVKRATEVCSEAPCPSTTTYYAGGGYTQTRRVEGATTDVEHRYRVFAGGGAIAELVRDGAGATVATWYPHTDALGSPNVLLDEAGTRLGQSFAPFGQATPDVPVGDSGSQMGFTGHDHDAEVGLIDMNGRVYDPTLGRFLTADPYVQAPFWSQGLNRYAYVFNSPLNYTDPSGFSAIDDYFQGLNDAPPEQAIPGYIGTALVAGLAAYTVYEAVSATISTSASNAAATSVAESGGGDAPGAGAPGAAYVATQRFSKAMGPTSKTVPGKPPTHALSARTGGGQQSATVQNRGGGIRSRTPTEAVYHALREVAQKQDPVRYPDYFDLEAFGFVYELDGTFGYTDPLPTTPYGVEPRHVEIALSLVPQGAVIVGDYHNHAVLGSDLSHEHFSTARDVGPADGHDVSTSRRFAKQFGSPNYRSYLGTPEGRLVVLDPGTGREISTWGPNSALFPYSRGSVSGASSVYSWH